MMTAPPTWHGAGTDVPPGRSGRPRRAGTRSKGALTHVVGDQSAVMRFLQDRATHGLSARDGEVQRIDTHGAAVFLAGSRAYKVKRAVCFPFMDFSTLARREEACHAEIAINRPNAPEIYIDAVAITRDKTGKLAINGRGEPIEWAVAMHRFDESQTFDELARHDALTPADLDRAVDALIAFQERAPERRGSDWVADLGGYIGQNDQGFHEAQGLFARDRVSRLTRRTTDEWKRLEGLLVRRGKEGHVLRCHGDVHLRNIVRLKAGVRLFDAVEFDDRIATGDRLYDLAFLLMDLDRLGRRADANRVLNRYLARPAGMDDFEALAALPLFLSIRAALRAKICAMSAGHLDGAAEADMQAEALRFFNYAADVLEPRDVSLTVVGGLSGTGKSAVAQALAPDIGRTPGAVVIRSDVVRKRLAGQPLELPLDEGGYSPDMTQTVYQQMGHMARTALEAGHSVIVDAVFAAPEEREAIEQVARQVECHFAGVWLEAPLDTRIGRIEARSGDPSDADVAVARKQESYAIGVLGWPSVRATAPLEHVLAHVRPLVSRLN